MYWHKFVHHILVLPFWNLHDLLYDLSFHYCIGYLLSFLFFFLISIINFVGLFKEPTLDLFLLLLLLFIYLFILFILFLAALCLRCGARASHCGGVSCCGAQALGTRASVVVARGL